MQKFTEKVEVILDALPYIRQFQDAVMVIKYGGSAMIDAEMKREVTRDISLLHYIGIKPVIVHGGGKEINKWLEKIGKKPEFAPDGLRVTDGETIEIAEMVLGRIGKDIVQTINVGGETSGVSVSGKDGCLLRAKKIESSYNHGFVGDITEVNTDVIHTLINAGKIPVISSIGIGDDGNTYNINADYAASEIAKALKADKLILMTDVDGVLDQNKKLIPRINHASAEQLIKDGTITGGMIPKIKSALDVLDSGVHSVHIINGTVEHAMLLEILTSDGVGTMVVEKE